MMKKLITMIVVVMMFSGSSFAASDNHVDRIPQVKDDWQFKDNYAPILIIEEKDANEFGSEDQMFSLILENAEWFEENDTKTVADMVYDGLIMSSSGTSIKIWRGSSKTLEVTINRGTVPTDKKAIFKIPLYSKVNNAGDVTVTIDSDTFISRGTYKYAQAIGKNKGSSNNPTVSVGHIFGKNNPVWLTIQEPLERKFGPDPKTFIVTLTHAKWVEQNNLNVEESIKNAMIKNVSDAKIVSMKKVNDQTVQLTINSGKKDVEVPAYFYIPLYIQVIESGDISLDIKSKEDIDFIKDISLNVEIKEYTKEIPKNRISYMDEKESNVDQLSLQIHSPHVYRIKDGETEKITLDVSPIIKNGKTLVPLRGVFEALGATVTWQPDIKAVLITSNDTTVQVYVDSDNGYINNQPIKIPMVPEIINDRVYVPLRFITESLDYHVQWIEEEKKIIITKE